MSPLFNEGADASFPIPFGAVSADGGALTYASSSAPSGATAASGMATPYVARRTSSGWPASPVLPDGSKYQPIAPFVHDIDPDLERALFGLAPIDPDGGIGDVDGYEGPFAGGVIGVTPAGSSQLAPENPYQGASADLSRLFFSDRGNGSRMVPTDATIGGGVSLVEDEGAGSALPQYRLVGLDNEAHQLSTCGSILGSGTSTGVPSSGNPRHHTAYHAISADGARVFFTAYAPSASQWQLGQCSGTAIPAFEPGEPAPADQLFARVDASETFDLARSPADCTVSSCTAADPAPVIYQGASKDGSRAFFTTSRPLTDADVDAGNDLYACDLPADPPPPVGSVNPCPDLIAVSVAGQGGEPADVQGVVRISEDGSHVYFVAGGVLTEAPNGEGATAAPGADNLYFYESDSAHPEGRLGFVGRLSSADTTAVGTFTDGTAQLQGLWGFDGAGAQDGRPAQASGDGRFLVFATAAQMTGDDTDGATDVYRYDSLSGALLRLSVGRSGYDDDGNNDAYGAAIPAPSFDEGAFANLDGISARNERALTGDGSMVFFQTSEPLAPEDANHSTDLYEWRDGTVSLLSDGQTKSDAPGEVNSQGANQTFLIGVTADGRDVFFHTPATLVAGASGAGAIYDARAGGGFPATTPTSCSGDACQGPPSQAPGHLSPGSAYAAAGEAHPAVLPPRGPKKKRHKKTKHRKHAQRANHESGGSK